MSEPKPPALTTPPTPTPPTPPIASVFDIQLSTDKKTLRIINTSSGLTRYIKLTSGDEILYSDIDEEFTYKKFFFSSLPSPNDYFKNLMTTIGSIDAAGTKTPEYQYLFGAVSSAKPDYYNHLKTVIGLEKTEPVKKKFNHKYPPNDGITVGWGMKNDDVPKHAHFGKNIILLNKLYYQNTLSIKDKKMHSVENFPNIKVSDNLTNILYHMCIKNTKPTKETLNSLNASEKKLFD